MPGGRDIVITGSVALDNIRTPYGEARDVLGGSATYSSFAASIFSTVRIISVVGSDFPECHLKKFEKKNIDISGLKISPGRTFRWTGLYEADMNEAKTLSVCPENLKDGSMEIPVHYRNASFLFLANTDPDVQTEILGKIRVAGPVLLDTMNLWIRKKPESLRKLLGKVSILLINETEARLFTGKINLVSAAKEILSMGPETVVIKKGEDGAILVTREDIFTVPAYPMEEVKDPTGAGDSFAGGFTGYLASRRRKDASSLRKAAVTATAVASFAVEEFSTGRLETIGREDIEERISKIKKMMRF